MRAIIFISLVIAVQVDSQFWKYPQQFLNNFSWLRQGKNGPVSDITTTAPSTTAAATTAADSHTAKSMPPTTINATKQSKLTKPIEIVESRTTVKNPKPKTTTPPTIGNRSTPTKTNTTPSWSTMPITTLPPTRTHKTTTNVTITTTTDTEATTISLDTTTQEVTGTTEEPRDNHGLHDVYLSKREKPQVKNASSISQNLLPLPAGASAALVKPTKYHYYPHNQHIYLLPECAIQQVCNAVYVRLNWTQPLCACPSRYRDPCSASLNSDDQHTTELMIDRKSKRAVTLVKTCEPIADMRICRAPRDWSLLALQNIRTGKSHYLVICRCPDSSILEGPMSHDQPTYASVPGIRVYGMMCTATNKRRGRPLRFTRSTTDNPPFPWNKVEEISKYALWD